MRFLLERGLRRPGRWGLGNRGLGNRGLGNRGLGNRGLSNRGWGSLAIVDQMVVSGTNFVTVAVLGRVAGAEVLGLYAVGFSLIMIVATTLRSLLITPYAVFAPRATEARRQGMRGCVVLGWTLLAGGITLLAGLVAVLLNGSLAATAVGDTYPLLAAAVTLALPAWALRETARQVLFADLRFGAALVVDGVASALQLGGLVFLVATQRLDAATMTMVLAGSCGVVGVGWLVSTWRGLAFRRAWLRADAGQSFRFGRWGALSQASHVLQGYALNWILAITGGFAAAGVYAALWSIVQLASPFLQGAGNAMTPILAQQRAQGGRPQLARTTARVTRLAFVAVILYMGAIALAGAPATRVIYGPQYDGMLATLVLLAGSVGVAALALVATKVISVLEYPHVNFGLNLAGLVMIVLFAAPLGHAYGLNGAAAGLLLAAALGTVLKWGCYALVMRLDDAEPAEMTATSLSPPSY
ncbi:MAG: hypothetical protein AAF089_11610 [Bacteroidota bacterium]